MAPPTAPPSVADRPLRILLVEDAAALARTYMGYLRDEPYKVSHVETGAGALEAVRAEEPDLVLLDLKLPDCDGMEVLRQLGESHPGLPAVVITAHGSIGVAVEAMRSGAADFLVKPFGPDRLITAIANHADRRRFAQALAAPPVPGTSAPARRAQFEGFVGASDAMQGVYRAIESAARSSATVFVTGESGVGKEVCAQAIHQQSPRRERPFVAINCAAIPGELMESEMFGHVKGAFTGAVADKPGAARLADGGTLFLDEICEMSPHLQTKLLRFVQTGAFNPVGRAAAQHVDVRFVCATNRDPLEEVSAGRFREDLYYRLHVIPIGLPPLRERGDDVLMIADRFVQLYAAEEGRSFKGLAEDARAALLGFGWPGNVRQLQNALRNAVVLNDGAMLTAAMLPALVRGGGLPARPAAGAVFGGHAPQRGREAAPAISLGEGSAPNPDDLVALSRAIRPLSDLEREAIERAVELCQGDVRKAAVFLGVSPATIYRKQKFWREGGDPPLF
ncbi:sigma-54 dependent transcriptional regulator [Neomegalonema sp.]|uniref:sigma-54-dependent transcriptional regulator n=1 Tax=Neomegalonema sp. TaxID=2039713 RepID=UPI00261E05CC|nr:sigma-54 dependent transcriptional regulator [Neomegalonema sp.]MDD2867550.1 sigma-54 dependent transcriptional regulator [Neomegalonema sp.]